MLICKEDARAGLPYLLRRYEATAMFDALSEISMSCETFSILSGIRVL